MTLSDLILALSEIDDVDTAEVLGMEVEFCTINRDGLDLLSVYEHEGKILIDVGTMDDSDAHNSQVLH